MLEKLLYNPLSTARLFLFEKDGGAGGAADTGTDPGTNGNAEGGASGEQQPPAKVTFTPEQQAHIDNLVKDRLAQQARAQKKKDDEAAAAAERKKLEEQGEFQKLAQTAEAEKLAAQAERDAAQEQLKQNRIRFAVERAAVSRNFEDAEDAHRLIDLGKIKLDDNGEVVKESVTTLLDELVKVKPYLVKKGQQDQSRGTPPRGPASRHRNQQNQKEQEESNNTAASPRF